MCRFIPLTCAAALAARMLGRPVRLHLTRWEFIAKYEGQANIDINDYGFFLVNAYFQNKNTTTAPISIKYAMDVHGSLRVVLIDCDDSLTFPLTSPSGQKFQLAQK